MPGRRVVGVLDAGAAGLDRGVAGEAGAQQVAVMVRSAWFAQNFSQGPPAAELRRGELVFPAGEVAEPFVDVRDVAEVVVAAPAGGERYIGRTPTVTGPRPLTWAEAVAEIAEATGRPPAYRAVPADSYGRC
ncbi:hypothetical protein ACF08A_24185 [Streptomyces cellulosae]